LGEAVSLPGVFSRPHVEAFRFLEGDPARCRRGGFVSGFQVKNGFLAFLGGPAGAAVLVPGLSVFRFPVFIPAAIRGGHPVFPVLPGESSGRFCTVAFVRGTPPSFCVEASLAF